MTYFIKTHADQRIRTRSVPGPLLRIGRGVNSDLRFEDTSISLDHALIQAEKGGFILTDQNSLTGCYVNGKRIRTAALKDGDKLEIGPYHMEVHISPTEDVMTLDLQPIAPEPIRRREKVTFSKVDYVNAYSLNRGVFNKWTLALLFLVGGSAVMGFLLWEGNWSLMRPGGVSEAHSLFTNQCSRCHEPWNGPAERACQKCHAVSKHQKNETQTPSCLNCHQEHRGEKKLIAVSDTHCVKCHQNLQTPEDTESVYEKTISDFPKNHPEFAITAEGSSPVSRLRLGPPDLPADTAAIKLNHHLHLMPDLKGPEGPVRMACQDCHQPAPGGKRMGPVRYERHCRDCHELGFEPRFQNPYVPHTEPENIHAYLLMVYAERRGEMFPVPEPEGRVAKGAPPPAVFKLDPWVIGNVSNAEEHLYKSTCPICHELKFEGGLPTIVKPGIPDIWFPHATFTHRSHRQLECLECHTHAKKSEKTSDLLLPGIQICRECHRNPERGLVSFQPEKASTKCTACHLYHDRSQEEKWENPLSIREFLHGS